MKETDKILKQWEIDLATHEKKQKTFRYISTIGLPVFIWLCFIDWRLAIIIFMLAWSHNMARHV